MQKNLQIVLFINQKDLSLQKTKSDLVCGKDTKIKIRDNEIQSQGLDALRNGTHTVLPLRSQDAAVGDDRGSAAQQERTEVRCQGDAGLSPAYLRDLGNDWIESIIIILGQ